MDDRQDMGAISGSREPDPSCTGSGPSGFDPERIDAIIASPWVNRRTPVGTLGCYSCPRDWPFPASHIAHPKLTNGAHGKAWPVCMSHVQHAMVAGWFPIEELTPELAQAIEARRAETLQDGSVEDESAVRKDAPTQSQPSSGSSA